VNDSSGDRLPPAPPNALALGAALLKRAKLHATVENEVIAAVQSHGPEVPRDERRTLLEEELQRRDITRDAIWIEQKLDQLEISGIQRTARLGDAILNLGELASSLRRSEKGTNAMPEWMLPPTDAQADMLTPPVGKQITTERSAIVLDPGTDSLLSRAVKEAPVRATRLGATVVVWFDRAPTDESQIAVHIGHHKIGTVAPTASSATGKCVDRAAQKGERPQAYGVLVRAQHRVPPYVLLVTLPTG
jgi:hypothetical protein